MGARISYCHLSFSLYLLHTVRMMFLPRLPLLMFIAFLGYCCNTIVKADEPRWPFCKSVQDGTVGDRGCDGYPKGDIRGCLQNGKFCKIDCGSPDIINC